MFSIGELGSGAMIAAILTYVPWNTMNFPAGIAPITKWNKDDDDGMNEYPRDDLITKMIYKYCDFGCQNLPLSVQVVARPFMDEKVLSVLSELETILNQI